MKAAPKSTPERKFNFVSGEVQALLAFAIILAKTSPQPNIVLSEFEKIEQARIAEAEMLLVGDELLQGFQFATAKIRKALEESAANHPNRG
jgi:hypothetical protein